MKRSTAGINLEPLASHRTSVSKNLLPAFAGALALGTFLLSGGMTHAIACSDQYTVKKNDTLHTLSQKYKVTEQQIKEANGLHTDKLTAGQMLEVPALHNEGEAGSKETHGSEKIVKLFDALPQRTYEVTSGDTLWALSKKFNISVEDLKSGNNKKDHFLRIGEKLNIPGEAAVYTAANVTGAADNHTVEFNIGKTFIALQVPHGKAVHLAEELAGKKVRIYYKNSKLMSYKY